MIRTSATRSTARAPVLAPLALLLVAAACGSADPDEQTAKIRAEYTVELNSWKALRAEPAPPPMDEMIGEETAGTEESAEVVPEETGETADEYADEVMPAGPQPTDVRLDLVVYFKGRKSLDGITVDVTHADASQQEKGVYRHYVETAGIVNGETRQVDFVLEDLDLEDGDAFAVSVASGIPADRSQYREFSESAP